MLMPFSTTEDLSSPFPLPLTSLAPPNAFTVNAKGKRVKDNKTIGAIDLSVSKALAPARTGWTGGWGTGTTSQSNGGGPDVGAACLKLMGRAVTMLAPAKDHEVEADLVSPPTRYVEQQSSTRLYLERNPPWRQTTTNSRTRSSGSQQMTPPFPSCSLILGLGIIYVLVYSLNRSLRRQILFVFVTTAPSLCFVHYPGWM